MEDPQIHGTIDQLVAEEHELWQRESDGSERRGPAAAAGREGLARPVLDLLRQRRARRNAGLDPEQAELRRPEVVENYEQ